MTIEGNGTAGPMAPSNASRAHAGRGLAAPQELQLVDADRDAAALDRAAPALI